MEWQISRDYHAGCFYFIRERGEGRGVACSGSVAEGEPGESAEGTGVAAHRQVSGGRGHGQKSRAKGEGGSILLMGLQGSRWLWSSPLSDRDDKSTGLVCQNQRTDRHRGCKGSHIISIIRITEIAPRS